MTIAQTVLSFQSATPGVWRANWAWGLPLIVLTVVIHVLGLGLLNVKAFHILARPKARHHPFSVFVLVMGAMTLLATVLHGMEAAIWAVSYQLLGARPDYKSAMLYSMGAMTTFGHAGVYLEDRWQLMGAIEALTGWLVFGLTTAFLFGMIQKLWSLESRQNTNAGVTDRPGATQK
jgi:MFS superfamily sulfate permease-like transporter